MAHAADELPGTLLKDVSRSFYLTLRALPGNIRPQIGLAYLLARTTDTIADTQLVPLGQRLQALADLRGRILGLRDGRLEFGELAGHQGSASERVLLEQCEASLAQLGRLSPADLQLVRHVLNIIVGGQELDLHRFANGSKENIVALGSESELDDYTYRVAGCVGEFWTKMCRAHVFPQAALDDSWLLANGARFGKGLQMVNILRDLPTDLRHGRCYLPRERLRAGGLKPEELLEPGNEGRLRPILNSYLDLAEGQLMAGWDYTNALPRRAVRVRLACSWPILIGMKTLQLLRSGSVLDAQKRIKVRRGETQAILLRSVLLYPWPKAWKRMAKQG